MNKLHGKKRETERERERENKTRTAHLICQKRAKHPMPAKVLLTYPGEKKMQGSSEFPCTRKHLRKEPNQAINESE